MHVWCLCGYVYLLHPLTLCAHILHKDMSKFTIISMCVGMYISSSAHTVQGQVSASGVVNLRSLPLCLNSLQLVPDEPIQGTGGEGRHCAPQ